MKATTSDFTRRRFTSAERARLLVQYHRGGLTQREFVEKHGLGLATLTKWLRLEKTGPRFQQVNLTEVMSAPGWMAEVSLPNGGVLRLQGQASSVWAAELLHALRSC